MRHDRFAALFLLELTTGIRRGQVCGLKWTSVDLEAGEITVHDNRVVVGDNAADQTDTTGPRFPGGLWCLMGWVLFAALRAALLCTGAGAGGVLGSRTAWMRCRCGGVAIVRGRAARGGTLVAGILDRRGARVLRGR